MIPLQLTDAALTATPRPAAPGRAQFSTDGTPPEEKAAFATMFDLLLSRGDGDKPAPTEVSFPAMADVMDAEVEQITHEGVLQYHPKDRQTRLANPDAPMT